MKTIGDVKYWIAHQLLKLYTTNKSNLFSNKLNPEVIDENLSIVISTFENRFHNFALPLIKSIRATSSLPLTIVINGNFSNPRDSSLYRDFLTQILNFDDVNIVSFRTFRGWSSLVNAGILHSDSDSTLVLNDDIYINSIGFQNDLAQIKTALQENDLVLCNNSWSHFAINRRCLERVGFLDENFLGIGEEDGDYVSRFKKLYFREVATINVDSLVNFVDKSRDPGVAQVNGKYSLFNNVYLNARLQLELSPSINADVLVPPGNLNSIYVWRHKVYSALGMQSAEEVSEVLEKHWKHILNKKK
jgi:hypothetical protein